MTMLYPKAGLADSAAIIRSLPGICARYIAMAPRSVPGDHSLLLSLLLTV